MSLIGRLTAAALAAFALSGPALAQTTETPVPVQMQDNGPLPWEMKLQAPATRVMEFVEWFNWYTVIIVTLITLFVFGLIAWCIVKYNHRAHPVPTRVTHNTTIEVLWTVLPILILVAIAVPSFRLLYGQYDPRRIYPEFDPATTKFLNVKVIGNQWFWDVEYSGDEESKTHGVPEDISFSALMIPDAEIGKNQVRNLSVDNAMVVPVDTFVRVQVTSNDVIHSFAMPSFGVKVDAVPGRLNETYFNVEREGLYYGQCSELCGKDHAFMPAAVLAVSKERFRQWAATAGSDLEGANQALLAALESDRESRTEVATR